VLPFLSTPVLLTLGSMWIRALPQYIGGGYATDLNPGRVASTFSKQVTAAWPGSYTLFDPKHHLEGVLSWRTLAGHWQLGLLVFVAVWALAAGMARRAREGGVRLAGVTGLGLLLAVLPAPLIAVCSRYQGELKYGLGHLPVYLEYFGVALLLGSAAAFLARRARLPGLPLLLPVALAALVSTVATVHREANLRVVASWREPFLTPRMEIEELVRAGFLERVPAGATLCTDFYPWDHDGNGVFFYSCYTRAPVGAVVPASGLSAEALAGLPDPQAQKRAAAPAGRVRYVRPGKAGGFAVTGTLRQVRATPGGVVTESALDMVRVAVSRTPGQPADRPFTLTAAGWDGVSLAGPRRLVVIPSDELIPVRRTRNWTIYDVPPRSHLEGESIQLGFSATDGAPSEALAPADLVRGRDLLLPEDHEPVIHLGFQGPCPPHGRTLIPLTTEGGWTFEAVLRPEPGQVHYATIASNHPGDGCDGFTIEQDGATPNAYLVQFGDGTAWHRVGRFQLTAGEWAHLAVVHERGRASVHVNGACVAVYERPGLTVHPSAMPLRLGDWAGSQRELHGTIREVRLLDQPLPAAEILRNSQRVLGALTAGEVHPAS
jgi:hypothetical protein